MSLTKACTGDVFLNPCCDVIFIKLVFFCFVSVLSCSAFASRSTSFKVFHRLEQRVVKVKN